DAPPPLPSSLFDQADPAPTLSESVREFLWDVEHHGNILNAHGFKRFADALRDADAQAMTVLLNSDFIGELPADPRETSIRDDHLMIVRHEDSGRTPKRVGREEFIAHLQEYRRAFTGKPPKVQFVLKTLLPKV